MPTVSILVGDGAYGCDPANHLNIAAPYHLLDNLGRFEKGKLVDLVILEADPLEDVSKIRKISLVMKDGQVVDREVLPTKKVLTVPRSTPSTSNKEEKQ